MEIVRKEFATFLERFKNIEEVDENMRMRLQVAFEAGAIAAAEHIIGELEKRV